MSFEPEITKILIGNQYGALLATKMAYDMINVDKLIVFSPPFEKSPNEQYSQSLTSSNI